MAVPKYKDAQGNWISIAGVKGEDGRSPYQVAVEGGYAGTEAEFNAQLAAMHTHPNKGVLDGITAEQVANWNEGGKAIRITTATLTAAGWVQEADATYGQTVAVEGLTAQSKVDFDTDVITAGKLPSPIRPVNEAGSLKAVTLSPPTADVLVQLTIFAETV